MAHKHTGVRPCKRLFGIMFTIDNRDCCSDHEGDFKTKLGEFDREAAERQCVLSREWLRKYNAGELNQTWADMVD